ncbi:MarR family transcriptional regulator [Roseomonas sp. 18066]|uniref:MarR family transcriptional regulator n=1 Tax=Roseomonas sp. 18066 TaxID=2681412 RepID=UPI00135C4AFB|nr:MarR family transcriptional regulator [Roseomonas sp. 18066]
MATHPTESALRAAFLTELSVSGRKLRTLFDAIVRKRGLTLARARLLLHLRQHGATRQGELAAVLELEHPTVVRLLDGLEKQGLIARHAVEGDRRAKLVAITEAAAPTVAELEQLIAELRGTLLAPIPEADLATASRVLAMLVRGIEAMGAAQPPR